MHRTAVCKARAATTCGVSTRNRSSPVVCAGADAGTEAAAELRPPPRRPFINRISNKACDICFGAAAAAVAATRASEAGSLNGSAACLRATAPVLARRRFFLASLGIFNARRRAAAAAAAMRARKKPAFFHFFSNFPCAADIACGARARDPGKARGDDLPHLLQNL